MNISTITITDLKEKLRHVPDFPQKGIDFIDITTLLQDKEYFQAAIKAMAEACREWEIEMIVGSEARGFIVGAPLAYELGVGFVPIRKPGKLPYKTIERSYSLEYGNDSICMHSDALQEGEKVLVVDDLLATGGTAKACCELVEALGAEVVGLLFLIELSYLNGRKELKKYPLKSLICFDE